MWEERISRSFGRIYWYNSKTGESVWECPNDLAIQVKHILVKHKDSRRPYSWKESNITRTKQEAIQKIDEYRAKIIAGESTIEEIAKIYSDCKSARDGGDLGRFGKGKMQREFEEASFSLEVGSLSQPVETESGIHLIYRVC
jgi:peptidyl-prolyl cis-trans isomerase NIMA-interacting 1